MWVLQLLFYKEPYSIPQAYHFCQLHTKYSCNKSQQDALFLKYILVKNSSCFGQTYCPSSAVLILYSQQLVFVTLVTLTVCQQGPKHVEFFTKIKFRNCASLCSNDCASLLVNKGETNQMQQLVILLVINCSSTCFGAPLRPSSGGQTAFHCLWLSILL